MAGFTDFLENAVLGQVFGDEDPGYGDPRASY